MNRIKSNCIIFMVFFGLGFQTTLISQPSEYLLKAVFLEKFTRFIEWPTAISRNDTTESFVIGILGKNPFDVDLNRIYMNQKIKNKPVKIRQISDLNDLGGCHLLFISKSETGRVSDILNHLNDNPILTVCDSDKLSGRGFIINMFVSDNKIRFEIDETAIHEAGFQVSYLLLQEARIVNPYKPVK